MARREEPKSTFDIFADDDENCCKDNFCMNEEECSFDVNWTEESENADSIPRKERKLDNLGRVRPSKYVKNVTKIQKKKPSKTEITPEIFFSTSADSHEHEEVQDCSPERKDLNELITGIMENGIVKENLVNLEDGFSFENLIPGNEEHIVDDDDDDIDDDDDDELPGQESQKDEIHGDSLIYPGHFMSIHHSMVLILLYAICHSISGSQLADLLALISLHCLQSHPGLKSIYSFKKYFADMQSPLKKHYFCKCCMTSVNEDDIVCQSKNCGIQLSGIKSKYYFIEIPLEEQLNKILQRPGILKQIKNRFNRKRKQLDGIEDIYDGAVYKKLSEFGGPLSSENPTNISFSWNTDGIPVFKSSKFSLWPFYLVINELPYKQRFSKENMILSGLWFGEKKPFMSLFTKPLMRSLKNLEANGIQYEVEGEQIWTKAFLICGTADLPAKSLVLNCNQFNGQFSCMKCLHPGETYKTQKGGSVHTFPYDASKPKHEKRTTESCLRDAVQATENRKTVNGMKGPSFLMTLNSYDFVKSTSVDYMHGVLLGITKLLINLWTSSTNSKESFSISSYVDIIDQRLLQIKPPSFITRVPRTLSDHFKYWKASELRSWLFFYSLPVLHDILPETFFLHFACFVQGIFLLSTDSVLPRDIQKSSILLSYFVHMFSSLYGERYVTLNMHSLLHLPQGVEELGPLWVYSCFPFENANGTLMELFHGTQNVELQILCGVNVLQNITYMIHNFEDERLTDFSKKLIRKKYPIKTLVGTSSGSFPIGMGRIAVLTDDIYSKLVEMCTFKPSKILLYTRVSLRGRVIHSMEYSRVYKRNTYTVSYFDPVDNATNYGQVAHYLLAKTCDCTENLCLCQLDLLAVIHELKCTEQSIVEENFLHAEVPHIKLAKKTNHINVVNVSKILNVVLYLNILDKNGEEKIFLCNFPNAVESD